MVQQLTYEQLFNRTVADPAVVGLVLKGSRAHEDLITECSDHDRYVVKAEGSDTRLWDLDGSVPPRSMSS
jgi:hypothetical protein